MARRRRGSFEFEGDVVQGGRKRRRAEDSPEVTVPGNVRLFDELPDEMVVSILAEVAATANSPADRVSAMLVCKRFRELGQHSLVLARASPRCIAVRANAWSDEADRFLLRCSDAGNIHASYLLGMITFYCLRNHKPGIKLIGAAACQGHAEALYSLGIMQFNGSGRSKDDRNLRGGNQLCAQAALRGHVDALRELGHCFSDGYGVQRSDSVGRRLLILASIREMRAAFNGPAPSGAHGLRGGGTPPPCLLTGFGCQIAAAIARRPQHMANAFLAEWFASRPGHAELRLCSEASCGRSETRRQEFRRCGVCRLVVYCSRACQALHWKAAHRNQCAPPVEQWLVLHGVVPNAN